MVRYCSVCGEELEVDEIEICDNCKASILYNENIPPDVDDFY